MKISGSLKRTAMDFGGVMFEIGVFNGLIVHGVVLVVIITVFIFIQLIGKEPPAHTKGSR